MVYNLCWRIIDQRGGSTIIYTYGDKAMDAVLPPYLPMPRQHKAAIQKRVEQKYGSCIIGADEPIMELTKYGQVKIMTNEEKALSMLSGDEFFMSFERLAQMFLEAGKELNKTLGITI